jgi:5-formyltetrahydrofolate cyclo-ligase
MKDYLRKKLINKRKKLSKLDVNNKSLIIEKKLFNLDEFKNSNNILFYVSYDNEVYTHDMIKKCLSMKKNIIVPISDLINKELILSKIERWDDLKKGSYNILEPTKKNENKINLKDIKIILIPAIAFDINGNRIGHGYGYYDKLLKKSNNALHIGLAFDFQIVDRINFDKHDVPVDKILTEKRIINCKNQ